MFYLFVNLDVILIGYFNNSPVYDNTIQIVFLLEGRIDSDKSRLTSGGL